MIGGTFIPKCPGRDQEDALRKIRQDSAGACADDLFNPVGDQPVHDLGRGGGPHGCLHQTDFFPAFLQHIDRKEFCFRYEMCRDPGAVIRGIPVHFLSKEGVDRLFGQDHIKAFVAGHDDGGSIGIIFQKGDFVFNDAHNEASGQNVPETVLLCYSSLSSSEGSLWSFTMLTALLLRSSSMAA